MHFIESNDSSYVIGGFITGPLPITVQDYFVLKVDFSGEIIWTKAFDNGGDAESLFSLVQSDADGYLMAGYNLDSVRSLNLFKIDKNGNVGCNSVPTNIVSVPTDLDIGSGGTRDSANFIMYSTNTIVTDITPSDTFLCYTCANPIAGFTHSDSLLSVTFSDGSSSMTNWVWDFGDGNSDTVQNPIHTYGVEGTYEVCLMASNICGTDTLCASVSVASVGIDGNAHLQSAKLYPNPTTGEIRLVGLAENESVQIKIFNILGELVFAKSHVVSQINIAQLLEGIYLMQIRSGEAVVIRKIVKCSQ